jgi:RES domain-containing protein
LKITAWRIFKKKYKSSAFTGEGARRFGGRWNSKGRPVIYSSASPSLAVLELLVHLQRQEVLGDYLLAAVTFDDTLVTSIPIARLPSNWRTYPAPAALKALGDRWIDAGASAVLRVPSVIIDTESNYLLNPVHSDFGRCVCGKPRPFKLDPRLA